MIRLDPGKRPPPYPDPGTPAERAARRRRGRAAEMARRLHQDPLSRTHFNLYSLPGRVYLCMFGALLGLGICFSTRGVSRRGRKPVC